MTLQQKQESKQCYTVGSLASDVACAAQSVRDNNPMAGSVTNFVTIDFVANAQLAVGGSAAMVFLPDEAEYLVDAGGVVYINMGTLLSGHGQTIPAAARHAHEAGAPWVLDPVGIGIGSLRTDILREIKPYKPAVIRANASETIALAGLWDVWGGAGQMSRVRGVDTTDAVDAALDAAAALARFTGGAVAVSGEEDLVCDGVRVAYSFGGSALAGKVTGFGCSLGGVAAVYATQANPFVAAVAAVAHYNVAGTRAAAAHDAPGGFKVAFLDELYRATPHDIASNPLKLAEI